MRFECKDSVVSADLNSKLKCIFFDCNFLTAYNFKHDDFGTCMLILSFVLPATIKAKHMYCFSSVAVIAVGGSVGGLVAQTFVESTR